MTLTISGREGTIYLIDANLFADVEQFRQCLQCIEASMLNKILTNHKDLVSYNPVTNIFSQNISNLNRFFSGWCNLL